MRALCDDDLISLRGASHPESDASFRTRISLMATRADHETFRIIQFGTGVELDAVGRRYGLVRHPRVWT